MATPYGSLSSRIPSSHRHKADIESAILALLLAQPQRWECDIVLSAHAQSWLVGLRCPALGVDYGFRVPPPLQTPEHIVGWLRRFTDVTLPRAEAPARDGYPMVADPGRAWATSAFPDYEERRGRGAADKTVYTGVERRRPRSDVAARSLIAPER